MTDRIADAMDCTDPQAAQAIALISIAESLQMIAGNAKAEEPAAFPPTQYMIDGKWVPAVDLLQYAEDVALEAQRLRDELSELRDKRPGKLLGYVYIYDENWVCNTLHQSPDEVSRNSAHIGNGRAAEVREVAGS